MPLIDKRDIDAIRSQADIAQIISHYIPVEKKGRNYVAKCPFHDDHDPSMQINEDKQIFHCFVCGTGGSLFGFIQKYEHVPFVQAVKKAADLIGYPLQLPEGSFVKKQSPQQPLYDALSQFNAYCAYTLKSPEGKAAYAYLQQRQFIDPVIERFQIGYAPASRQIRSFLQAKKLEPKQLLATGLIVDTPSLDVPFFHDRITIPIHDEFGNPIAITARTLPGNSEVKYINTAQTEIYDKGSVLFNYHRAKEASRQAGRVILVEGAMDVLGLEKAEIHEGIAALGTACTDRQIELIARLHVPVHVFYDGDTAGHSAVWKFGLKALEAGIEFVVVSGLEAKDPDEIFCTYGKEALKKAVSRTVPFVEFAFDYLKSRLDMDNYEDRKKYASRMRELIVRTASVYEAPAYYARLKEISGFDFSQTPGFSKDQPAVARTSRRRKQTVLSPAPQVEQAQLHAQKAILACMLADFRFVERFKSEIGYFSDPACQELALYIYEAYRHSESIEPAALVEEIEEDGVAALLMELSAGRSEDILIDPAYFEDALIRLKQAALCEQIALLDRKMKESLDAAQKMDLAMKRLDLIRKKNALPGKEQNA